MGVDDQQQGRTTVASPPGAAEANGDAGLVAVERAAGEEKLSGEEERSVLDWLLGVPVAQEYTVPVQFETPHGMKDLRFVFRAMDGRKLDEIETKAINQATGMMDKLTADAELVMEATLRIEDPATGRSVRPRSEEFRKVKEDEPPLASGIDALMVRFSRQAGLLAGVAAAIRDAAGFRGDRVGKSSRVLVEAAGK